MSVPRDAGAPAGRLRHPLLVMAAAAVCFALMAFAAKLAAARLPAGEVAFARFAFMLVPLLAVPALLRRALEFERLDLLIYRGVFGGSAVLLYFLAIGRLPVGLATLLTYTSPIFSIPFAARFLGEPAERRLLPALGAALCGLPLAAGLAPGQLHANPWIAVGVISAVLSGAALAAIRAARRTEGSWSIYGSFTLCGLAVTAPFALSGWILPTGREWLLLAAVGACSVAAQLLMTYAYRWVTNLQAGVLSQLTVVLTILLGWVYLGDRLTPLQLLGSMLVVGGVLAVVRRHATPRAFE